MGYGIQIKKVEVYQKGEIDFDINSWNQALKDSKII